MAPPLGEVRDPWRHAVSSPGARAPLGLWNDCYGFNLDEKIGPKEARHLHQRACWWCARVDELVTHAPDGRELTHGDDKERELDAWRQLAPPAVSIRPTFPKAYRGCASHPPERLRRGRSLSARHGRRDAVSACRRGMVLMYGVVPE